MVGITTFQNDKTAAETVLQKAEDTCPANRVGGWFAKPTSLASEYLDQSYASPNGHRWCVDNAYIENDADVITVLEPAFTTLPSKKAYSLWFSMAPGSRRKLPDMALSMQSDHYFAAYVAWEDAKDDTTCREWVKSTMAEIEPHAAGAYLGDSDFQVRQTRYWGREQGERLKKIRRQQDPQGLFCGYLDRGDTSRVNHLPNL